MSDTIIKVKGVSKKYCRSIKHTMFYGAIDLAKSFFGLNQRAEILRDGEFWALSDVSFELKRGECLGLIGQNGSGKSTLLKMLNGIFMPDKGSIEITGRVGALIEVGAGFHPLLTGRENIYVNGAILGMTKREIDKKFDEIVDFAGIGDFLDSPVKHYSSGMYVRLGFAIASHAALDILIADEVLSVGDFSFQKKCNDKMMRFKTLGKIIILVSHNLAYVKSICDKVICLDGGMAMAQGSPEEAIDFYLVESPIQKHKRNLNEKCPNLNQGNIKRRGSREIEITEVGFFDDINNENNIFKSGERFTVRLKYLAHRQIKRPVFGVAIHRDDGIYCFGIATKHSGYVIEEVKGTGVVEFTIDSLPLLRGTYLVTVAALDELDSPYDHHVQKYKVQVVSGETEDRGIFQIPCNWKIKQDKPEGG